MGTFNRSSRAIVNIVSFKFSGSYRIVHSRCLIFQARPPIHGMRIADEYIITHQTLLCTGKSQSAREQILTTGRKQFILTSQKTENGKFIQIVRIQHTFLKRVKCIMQIQMEKGTIIILVEKQNKWCPTPNYIK